MAIGSDATILEQVTFYVNTAIQDQAGVFIPASALNTLMMTLYETATDTILNSRYKQNVLNQNGVTVSDAGALEWIGTPADSVIYDSATAANSEETHKALFEWTWGALSTGTLGTDPFAMVDTTPTVTVTHTAHGLAVGDAVVFTGAGTVNGLLMDGLFIVVTVPTADSYTLTHQSNATSTASGGGAAVLYYYKGKSGKREVGIKVTQLNKVPHV